jgi:hypothetical protein
MAHSRQTGIEDDVRALMGAVDEDIWQEVGLFTTVDSLGVCNNSLTHTLNDLTSPQAHPNRRILGGSPPFTDFLPGLSESNPTVEKLLPVCGLREGDRGTGFPCSQSKGENCGYLWG